MTRTWTRVRRALRNGRSRRIKIMAVEFDRDYYLSSHEYSNIRITPEDHYDQIGWREGADPTPWFSTRRYLELNADVRAAGVNPFVHYLEFGRREGRPTGPARRVTADRSAGAGEWSGYHDVKSRDHTIGESNRRDVSLIGFAANLAGADLAKRVGALRLKKSSDRPLVSVVIPCINQETVTAECLASLFAQSEGVTFEIIVVDNGSSDGLYKTIERHQDIEYIRFEDNIGFGPACNAGAAKAVGDYILFLNNDAQVGPTCLASMAKILDGDARVGAVGPKLLNFDGTLQESGATIGPDGCGRLVGFGLDPNAPRFSYSREVEYISGAALMVRRAVFQQLGGFDDVYAPAYCEDVDLCFKIREAGFKLFYDANAIAAHHLSKTTRADKSNGVSKTALVNRNRRTLIRRWGDKLTSSGIRTIAFYLPQFHPVPQNDLWWGKGFTEWSNTTKATPNFAGQRQPRLPADLGYYDLRVPEVMEAQAKLARRYGIDGFCYYYYWFDGERVLEMPLERLLKTGKPDIPFCLCWANENWTRRWDGRDDDILLHQTYDDEHAVAIASDIGRYFDLENYIRVDGRPIFLLYRVEEIPNPIRFIESCRNVWRREGKGEVMVAIVESFDLATSPQDPACFGADISVEFPPHGMVSDPALDVERTNPDWTGSAHDYRELAANFMTRVEPGFKRIRSVLVGWDSTPRHRDRSLVLENSTPGAFQAWLEWTYRRTRDQNFGDERLVFVNAWNEWAEGNYLEPDTDFGHGYLEAVRNAKEAADFGDNVFEE